jgi:hypothetical protein
MVYEQALVTNQANNWWIINLRYKILQYMVGLDTFWLPSRSTGQSNLNASTYFGNAWCMPFPLTVIIRYDTSGEMVAIMKLDNIEEFMRQNKLRSVEKQKEICIALRCLDTIMEWPYTHTEVSD